MGVRRPRPAPVEGTTRPAAEFSRAQTASHFFYRLPPAAWMARARSAWVTVGDHRAGLPRVVLSVLVVVAEFRHDLIA